MGRNTRRLSAPLPIRGLAITLLIGIGLLILIPWLFAPHSTSNVAGLYDSERGARSLVYDEKIWAPKGALVEFPDSQMVVVGETQEGYRLFANREQGYPGGGGGASRIDETQPYGRLYLKTTDGRYQPLVTSSFTREKLRPE